MNEAVNRFYDVLTKGFNYFMELNPIVIPTVYQEFIAFEKLSIKCRRYQDNGDKDNSEYLKSSSIHISPNRE